MNRLQGKIAIITGASRQGGIGTAIARTLAKEGADIFFTHLCGYDRTMSYHTAEDDGWPTLLADELRQLGVRAESMELNLADEDSWLRLLDEVEARLGSPAILINNATHCIDVDFRQLTAEVLDDHCAVNIRGTCMLSAEFAKRLENKQGGRIINLISGQDKSPQPHNLAYVTTKGAISAFTRSLAAALAPLHITVNAINPGPTDTGWMDEALKEFLLPRFPMGRIGQPEDAARLIAFLASDDAGWITGQIIHSDGGFREF